MAISIVHFYPLTGSSKSEIKWASSKSNIVAKYNFITIILIFRIFFSTPKLELANLIVMPVTKDQEMAFQRLKKVITISKKFFLFNFVPPDRS